MLVFSAVDFEDFLEPRPDLDGRLEGDLEQVVLAMARQRLPDLLLSDYICRAEMVQLSCATSGTILNFVPGRSY